MTDTRERFLREITERVPADRIAELHLFRPLRRGATETGIAVIAAELDDEPRAPEAPAVELADMPPGTEARAAELDGTSPAAARDMERVDAPADDSPYAPDDHASEESYPTATHPERHTVFTARYRLTIKGADRGKWEFDVVADADAPLTTVDSVVRGVQRRAGDEEEPERLTSDGVRAALDGLSWRTTT